MRTASLRDRVVVGHLPHACLGGSSAVPGARPTPRPPIGPPIVRSPAVNSLPTKPPAGDRVDWKYPILDKGTDIAMESAEVNVDLTGPPGRNNSSGKLDSVWANVRCGFQLKCLRSSKPSVTFVAAFPIDALSATTAPRPASSPSTWTANARTGCEASGGRATIRLAPAPRTMATSGR